MCNQVHPLNGALPGPYVRVWVTRDALVAHRFTYALPRCRTSQYRRTFIFLPVSLWNDHASPVFDGVRLAGFKSRANALRWPQLLYPYYSLLLFFPSSPSFLFFGLIGCISISLSLALPTFFNNNNKQYCLRYPP